MKRYDYRTEYKNMNYQELCDVLKTLISRILDASASGNWSMYEDVNKRISYIQNRMKKLENKQKA